jgi:hypothetical protein
MAELNFNALIPQGPRGFYQGFEQGQDQKIARETNQIKLDELKRDRDEMIQLQEKLKGLEKLKGREKSKRVQKNLTNL